MSKVAILFSISHKAPNGASSFVHSFIEGKDYFAKNNVDLHIFSRDDLVNCNFTDKKAIKRKQNIKASLFKVINHSPILTVLYDYFMESRSARTIVKHYLRHNFNDDLVHCQELQTAYYLLKYSPELKVAVTLHSDGSDFDMWYESRPAFNSWLGRKYLSNRLKYVVKKAAGIGFVSKNSMEIFGNNHPEIKHKLFYVYNGIQVNSLTHEYYKKDIVQFICVGTVGDRKNQRTLIEAIKLLPKSYQDKQELIIVGDGSLRVELENYTQKHNITNVKFLGSCNNVQNLLKEADCFILVSKNEGLPISIIEAMREGLPIIGSDVAGIPEMIIQGESGHIIPPIAEDTSKAIKKIIDAGWEKRMQMGKRSYELFLEKFSLEIMYESYINTYNRLINE